jgi:methionyl-tRNA formyltransferase
VTRVPVLAVGRSGLLYDAVRALAGGERYSVAAIITDEAYAEYDVGVTAFADLAAEVGAEFVTRRKVSAELVADLVRRLGVQVGISANWRFLIPAAALQELPHGILNLHLGRLPDYKGNATVNWAIVNGEPDICADVHRMVPDLDAGDVLARATLEPCGSTGSVPRRARPRLRRARRGRGARQHQGSALLPAPS